MREHLWRAAITRAVHSNDPAQINALASRLAACERAASILQHHGQGCSSQPLDVAIFRALNVKALDE